MLDLPKHPIIGSRPILNAAFDGVAILAPSTWRIVFVNEALSRWLDYPADQLEGQLFDAFVHPRCRQKLCDALQRTAAGETVSSMDVQLNIWQSASSARFCRVMVDDQPCAVVILQAPMPSRAQDPSAGRRDPLTQLPDRAFLLSRLSTLLEGDRTVDRQFAVLFIDLDNFKQINDRHGHLLGDSVLCEVADRLSGCVREGDHVTRFGGDEFVVLLDRVTGPDEVEPVIARIHEALATPIERPEGEFSLSLSIGVSLAAAHHRTAEDVLRDADRQMYAAKRAAV